MHPLSFANTRVIHLSGNDRQIGVGHYEQIGTDCGQGVQIFLSQFIQNLIQHASSNELKHILKNKMSAGMIQITMQLLQQNIPKHIIQRIEALCEAGDFSKKSFLSATVAADLFPILNSILFRIDSGRFAKPRFPNIFGCSSFFVKAPEFIIGRNLDFPGVGYWDKYQVIQCVQRNRNFKYITLTTAGCPYGGITGINEHKIYVALHQHYGRNFNIKGELPFIIGERILENARSLDDARKILVNSQTASSWAFVIADGKNDSAFICEKTPKSIGFRKFEPGIPLCHTNKFMTSECIPNEFAVSERMNWDTHSRRIRMEDLLKGRTVDVSHAIQVVSDHFDPYLKTESVAGRTVSAAHNIQSLVLDMKNFALYLAEGSSPIQIRTYRKYDLADIFSGGMGKTSEEISSPIQGEKTFAAARESYSLSFIQSMNREYRDALTNLRASLEYGENGFLRLIEAQLLMKLFKFEEAANTLDDSRRYLFHQCKKVKSIVLPPEYFEMILWQARAYRLLNQDEKANETESLIRGNPEVKDEYIRRELEDPRPYSRQHLSQLTPAYSLFIPQ